MVTNMSNIYEVIDSLDLEQAEVDKLQSYHLIKNYKKEKNCTQFPQNE